MATEAQIEANRRNAQLSTGPRTPEGKAAVCQNAFKHGLRSAAYLEHEGEPEHFERVSNTLLGEYQPQTMTEEFYVERMVIAECKLVHLEHRADEFYSEDRTRHLIEREMRILERSFDKAMSTLKRLQKDRQGAEKTAEKKADAETAALLDVANKMMKALKKSRVPHLSDGVIDDAPAVPLPPSLDFSRLEDKDEPLAG